MNRHRQPGTALVTALLVVAIASVAAAALLERQRIDIRRTDNVLTLDQAYIYARAAETWATQILLKDAQENETDSLLDQWSALLEPVAIEGGSLSAQVFDQQARFNLNNLVEDSGKASKKDIAVFERLLGNLQIDTVVAAAVVDWLDADINARLAGAEDLEYLALDEPYRAANRLFTSVSELRRVKGISDEIYKKLLPYVTVLPRRTRINVNTADKPVLMAVVKGLDESTAEGMMLSRAEKPFPDEKTFRGQQALEGLEVGEISVGSSFYQVEARINFGRSRITQLSLVERNRQANNGQPGAKIIILGRSRGGLS